MDTTFSRRAPEIVIATVMTSFDRIMQIDGLCSASCMETLVHFARLAPPGGYVIDLGTYRGRSAAMLCLAVGDDRVVTIDHWRMPSHGGSTVEIARANLRQLGYAPRLLTGLSHEVPPWIDAVSVLFIDSYHNDKTLRRELAAWLPLVLPQGVVMLHDFDPARFTSYVDLARAVLRSPSWATRVVVEDLAVFEHVPEPA